MAGLAETAKPTIIIYDDIFADHIDAVLESVQTVKSVITIGRSGKVNGV